MTRERITTALLMLCVVLSGCDPPSQQAVEREIATYPLLREADLLSRGIPTPPEFELVGKTPGSNSVYALVDFFYRDHMSSAEVLSFYEEYFTKMGWQRTSFDRGRYDSAFTSVQFSNGGRFVAVANLKTRSSDYTLSCGVFKQQE